MPEGATEDNFLSIQEAADYVGVNAQTLRRWDASDRLRPVRHPANGYRYYRRSDLEPFRLEFQRAQLSFVAEQHFFQKTVANVEGNERLREPQKEAHRAVREHFEESSAPAIVQIPVGCGKTGVIATLPFGIAKGRTLVIAPNLTIRKGIADALDISSTKCFWTRTRVLQNYTEGPFAAVLEGSDANVHDCTESHFVVTNIQQLASSADRWLPQFPRDFFDLILVDEGHHAAADSWRKVFDRFPSAKVVGLTATPFRSDERQLDGEVVYRYPFAQAMMRGYIKEIHSQNVAPSEIYFTYDGDERRHTLEEVLRLREEQWFRRGVALAPECNRHIAEASIARMRMLRDRTGMAHQIIASACSVDHARQVRAIFEEYGIRAKEIHSQMVAEDQEAVLAALRGGRIDCVVQVQMLGEGFDHPALSVAAVFRPYRSLAPYIQFVGRVMRVVHEGEPGHADNHAFVVSHVGLNNEERWEEFRELDIDDQALLRQWVRGSDAGADEPGEEQGGRARRFDGGMDVMDELVSHFVEQSFLDPEDDRVLDKLLAQPIAGTGLTVGDVTNRELLRSKLRAGLEALQQEPQSMAVQPQRQRQSLRKRLSERTRSVANRVLQDLGLSRQGRQIAQACREAGGKPNFQAAIVLLNIAVNDFIGCGPSERDQLPLDRIQAGYAELDALGDELRERVRNAVEGAGAEG